MSVDACAALVERGDPDRFMATMAAPPAARAPLFVLYAFNLEVARAPWVATEPMIAEMRLQWWRDVVADAPNGKTRAHEVAGPLADLIREKALPVDVFDRLIAARRWDVYRDAFADAAAFDAYLDDTGAGLMWLCAVTLGAGPSAEPAVRGFGQASALATYLQAVPALEARGRMPLVDGRPAAIAALATKGLARISAARQQRHSLHGPARAALLAGWQAEVLLQQVALRPQIVAAAEMGLSEFARRGKLAWQTMTGRW